MRRAPRIVPTLVMSAGFASVIPTCTLVTAEQGCGSNGPNTCTTCYDVADVTFGDHFKVGTDVAAEAFAIPDVYDDTLDATIDDASDASDAPDDRE